MFHCNNFPQDVKDMVICVLSLSCWGFQLDNNRHSRQNLKSRVDKNNKKINKCTVRKPVWHIPLLCVQWRTPDDGQRNCPKHVELYFKNKFEKLVHLVGFIIRIYQDARSPERQINATRQAKFLRRQTHVLYDGVLT